MTIETIEVPGKGFFTAVWNMRGLEQLLFPGEIRAPRLSVERNSGCLPGWHAVLDANLRAYFCGRPVDFSGIPVDLKGYTPFQAQVLSFIRGLPFGSVSTYGQVAGGIGRPGGARAVGQALGRNRTPIIIPCHRVLGSRSIGGFSSGLSWKETLLRLEGFEGT
ncbi:MAG: methylated-DNA--[protein]-cysteine S-methyltransferase [Bacillota bacterium]